MATTINQIQLKGLLKIKDYIPAERLRPYVKAYRLIESKEELQNRVLPNTSLALSFRIKGENAFTSETGAFNLPSITFTGLRKSFRLINYTQNTSTLIVLFREGGASAFFKEPLYELFENSISLGDIIHPTEIEMVEGLLNEGQLNLDRVAVVERFLLQRLDASKTDKLITEAVKKIYLTSGNIRIRDLAEYLFISIDPFEKRFRKVVGSSPKQFASIVRLSSIVHRKQQAQNLFEIAFEAGYYDQAHFNKDFKRYTGLTPLEFFKTDSFW